MSYFPVDKLSELYAHASSLSNDGKVGTIHNLPEKLEDLSKHDETALSNCPLMTGKFMPALHESHVFLGPVWMPNVSVDDELVTKYKKLVEKFNEIMRGTYESFKEMKSPVLCLNFKNVGYVTVMQSSLYVLTDSREAVIEMTHQIAQMFRLAGFDVLREKIEATAFGINGIPQTAEEACKYGKYFEFHIRVGRKDSDDDGHSLSKEEVEQLVKSSEELSELYGTPVPLSYNLSKEVSGQGYQRYLNVRFRNLGMHEIKPELEKIYDLISLHTDFKKIKTIEEYVWYDSFVGMDKGWIDF